MRKYIDYLFFLKASVMILLSSTEETSPQSQIQQDVLMIKSSVFVQLWLVAKKALSNIDPHSRFIYIQIKCASKTPLQLEGEDFQFICQGPRFDPPAPLVYSNHLGRTL